MSEIEEKLRKIQDFGGIDASTDRVLLAAFEDHNAYRNALNFTRPLVTGRKGSGKSAVYQKITREPKGDMRALGFTFSDYPWQHHGKQKQVGVPDEECYRQSWQYFIALMLCKLILKSKDAISGEPGAQSAIHDIQAFVYDSYGSLDPSLTSIFTPGQRIKVSGKLNFWGVGGAEAKVIDIEHLPTFYPEINRNMHECILRCIPRELKFYLCFDELDLSFDPANRDYLLRLIGLLRAAKYVNERFIQEDIKAGVIILLRDDIWHTLRFEDKNKIAESQLSEIKWSEEAGPHSLKRLMERRFGEVLGDGQPISWDQVFDESRTMAQFKTKYDYICRRTFLRPRDMIHFCNKVLIEFKAAPGSGGFETEHVKTAEKAYSSYFMRELEDELHKHSVSYERYFDVLKSLLNVSFSLEEFEAAWEEHKSLFDKSERPDQALQALFDFSVVGFLATGGQSAGSKYVWRYLDTKTRFNPSAKSFQVHLGLKEEFELKLYARRNRAASQ